MSLTHDVLPDDLLWILPDKELTVHCSQMDVVQCIFAGVRDYDWNESYALVSNKCAYTTE